MKIFIATALLLISASSFAGEQIIIPQGTKVEKYKYNTTPNNDPVSLAACGVYSKLSNEDILKDLTFKYDSGPYYQYLATNKNTVLTVQSKEYFIFEGNDCEYKGYGYEDPDWECSEDIRGHWMNVALTLKDKYGNTWTTSNQTDLVAERSQLPSQSEFGPATLKDIQGRMGICQFQD